MEILHSKIIGEGRPLLILHGFLGMSDNWKSLGAQFAENNFTVHLLDLRNHGKSFHSKEFTYSAMVSDVLAYCDFHKLETFDVIGHSMGGKLAMFLASAHPDRVNKLIVADIAPKYYAPHHEEILAGLNAVDFASKPSRSEVEQIIGGYVKEPGTLQFLMKNVFWKTPEQLAFRFNLPVLNDQIDNLGEALPQNAHFDKAALFLRGGNSNYIQDEDIAAIKGHFPKAITVSIKDAGHWLHAEKPKEFFDTVFYFLSNN